MPLVALRGYTCERVAQDARAIIANSMRVNRVRLVSLRVRYMAGGWGFKIQGVCT